MPGGQKLSQNFLGKVLSTIKYCTKTFLKYTLRLLKSDDVSTLDKRHYQVQKIFVSCSLFIQK